MSYNDYYDNKLVLLGPGSHVQYREDVKKELMKMGYRNILIMESYPDSEEDTTFDDKFRRMLDENSPDFYFAFFHRDARMDGVTFEIGWLCGTLTIPHFADKLILMMEYGYNFNQTTSYMARLPFRVKSLPFDESRPSSRPSILIHTRVRRPLDK